MSLNWQEDTAYLELVEDLIYTDDVQSLKNTHNIITQIV